MSAVGLETEPLNETREKPQQHTFEVTKTVVLILLLCAIASWMISFAIMSFVDIDDFKDCEAIDTTQLPKTIEIDSRPVACNKRIVGYYTETESIDVTSSQLEKLTHAIFAYVHINWDGALMFKSENAQNKFLSLKKKVKALRSSVKVMFAIGGEHNSEYFANIAAQPGKTTTLINSIVSILLEHQIDGIDIYWKYAKESDKFIYIALLKDLRSKLNEFRPYRKFTVSITLPAARISDWELAYDLDQTLEHTDFINVFSMDYHGPWEHRYGDTAGPSAPLYGGFRARKNFNVHVTMQYYVCRAKQPEKFNIAIPFYAMLWRNVLGPFAEPSEAIRKVELKDGKAEGKAYMSRIQVDQDRWKLDNATWDDALKAAYIWVPETRTYLTFENKKSLAAKIDYVNSMSLGGVWIWLVDMDDEQNSLLNTLSSNELCSNSSVGELMYNC